jgi:hypothetical protein
MTLLDSRRAHNPANAMGAITLTWKPCIGPLGFQGRGARSHQGASARGGMG